MPNTPAPGMKKRSRFAYLGCASLIVTAIVFGIVFAFNQASGAEPTQRVTTTPRLRIARQTADSAFVVGTCTVSNADTARFAWTYPGYTRAVAVRPASCRDTARVRRGTVAQSLRLDVTAKMGATVGNTRFASLTIPARAAVLPPTVDAVAVDTVGTPIVVGPPAVNFFISPDMPTLRTGALQQFTPTVQWPGAATGFSVTWSATGGTINQGGTYTAGSAAGRFVVVAQCSCFARPDTAVVTITAGTPPVDTTPPVVTPPVGGTAPNLPAGMRLVAATSFETYTDGSANADGIQIINWAQNVTENAATFGVRSVASSGGIGNRALRVWFPGNHAGDGVGPLTAIAAGLNSRAHYMVVRMRYMPGYVFHSNSEKLFYPVGPQLAGGGNGPAYSASLNVSCCGHFIGYNTPIETSPVGEPLSAAGVVPIGRWFTAEFYADLNTPGQANGTRYAWIDGVRVVSKTGHMFTNSAVQQLFDRGRLDFTRGGGPSSVLTPTGGQWLEVDYLAFYVR